MEIRIQWRIQNSVMGRTQDFFEKFSSTPTLLPLFTQKIHNFFIKFTFLDLNGGGGLNSLPPLNPPLFELIVLQCTKKNLKKFEEEILLEVLAYHVYKISDVPRSKS